MQKSVAIVANCNCNYDAKKDFQLKKFLIDWLGQFSWNLIADSNNSWNYYSEIERDPELFE